MRYRPRDLSKTTTTNVPRYIINLDAPPEDRWSKVVEDFKPKFPQIMEAIEETMQALLGSSTFANLAKSLAGTFFSALTSTGAVFYYKELQAISKQSGISLGLLTLMQLSYELSACCTSMVRNSDTEPIHIRSMDWGMDILKELTIECDFQRKGKTVFYASTWAGYVGVLTGMRKDAFSVSINFRNKGESFAKNLWQAMNSGWPIGFLTREVLDDASTYATAVQWLANSKLISPVYITVCGLNKGEGALITRNREAPDSTVHLNSLSTQEKWTLDKKHIIQTNCDWWIPVEEISYEDDILMSKDRLKLSNRESKGMEDSEVTPAKLLALYSKYPVQNELTIYVTLMCPKTGLYNTILV